MYGDKEVRQATRYKKDGQQDTTRLEVVNLEGSTEADGTDDHLGTNRPVSYIRAQFHHASLIDWYMHSKKLSSVSLQLVEEAANTPANLN